MSTNSPRKCIIDDPELIEKYWKKRREIRKNMEETLEKNRKKYEKWKIQVDATTGYGAGHFLSPGRALGKQVNLNTGGHVVCSHKDIANVVGGQIIECETAGGVFPYDFFHENIRERAMKIINLGRPVDIKSIQLGDQKTSPRTMISLEGDEPVDEYMKILRDLGELSKKNPNQFTFEKFSFFYTVISPNESTYCYIVIRNDVGIIKTVFPIDIKVFKYFRQRMINEINKKNQNKWSY